jgi:hypothetical protein
MKKYRLKEEVKKFIGVPYPEAINTLEYWDKCYVKLEALEEVPSRIELSRNPVDGYLINRVDGEIISDQEKDLCEKALNGELFTKDDMEAFVNYSRRVDNINSPTNMLIKDFLRMNNDTYQNNT